MPASLDADAIIRQQMQQAQAVCDQCLTLDLAGFIVEITTNSSRLHQWLADYYPFFLAAPGAPVALRVIAWQGQVPVIDGDWQPVPPEPGKTTVKEMSLTTEQGQLIAKRQSRVHMLLGAQNPYCFGALEDNPGQLVNLVNHMHLRQLLQARGLLCHAAGVCRGSAGIALAGASGQGKTTLALSLLQRGLDLVSNDRLVITPGRDGLQMQGIVKYPRVNPGTLLAQPALAGLLSARQRALYGGMSTAELWGIEDKHDVAIEPLLGSRFQLEARLKAVVILDWRQQADSPMTLVRQDPASVPAQVASLIKGPWLSDSAALPAVADYTTLLQSCDFYLLQGCVDFDRAMDAVLALC